MEHDLEAYRKQCAGICAAVPKNSTNLKLVFDLEKMKYLKPQLLRRMGTFCLSPGLNRHA